MPMTAAEPAEEAREEAVVIPFTPVLVNVVEIAEAESAESGAVIHFFENSSFSIVLPDNTYIRGSFAFVDGLLTLTLEDGTQLTVGEDGQLILTLDNGETVVFILDEAFLAELLAGL